MYRYKCEIIFNTNDKFEPMNNVKAGGLEKALGAALGSVTSLDVIVIDSVSLFPLKDPRKVANDAAKAGVVIVSATQEKAQSLFDYEKERVLDCD